MSLSKQLQGDRNIVKEKKAERTKLHLNNKIYKTIKWMHTFKLNKAATSKKENAEYDVFSECFT